MRPGKDLWWLTPLGEARLTDKAAHVPTHALAINLGQVDGSEFGKQQHPLIPPLLGPMGEAPGLQRIKPTFLSDHDASVEEIHKWIRDDLGLPACPQCPLSTPLERQNGIVLGTPLWRLGQVVPVTDGLEHPRN